MAAVQKDRFAPAATVEFFKSVPWTAALIAEPQYMITTSDSRYLKKDNEDAFLAVTLATAQTVPHLLPLALRSPPLLTVYPATATTVVPYTLPRPEHPNLIWLLSIAAEGTSGFPNMLHGGAIATLIDECMNVMVASHLNALEVTNDRGETKPRVKRDQYLTSKLELKYKRPTMVPGIFAIKGWINARQEAGQRSGRMWTQADLVDAEGNVYVEAKGLFVQIKAKL